MHTFSGSGVPIAGGAGAGNCPRFPHLSIGTCGLNITPGGDKMRRSRGDAKRIRDALLEDARAAMEAGKPFPKSDYLALSYGRHPSQMARHVQWLDDAGMIEFHQRGHARLVVRVAA